jgi:hypothetical protein
VNLQRFVVILVLVVVMGLVLVYEHALIIHSGYEMAKLSQQRDELNEQQRKLAAELVELKRPELVSGRVKEFGVQLVPMEKKKEVVVKAKQETRRKR